MIKKIKWIKGRAIDRNPVIISMWSAKGGVGLSVTAAAVALSAAQRDGEAVLLDLGGDQAAILGVAEPAGPGVFDWLCSNADSPDSLRRLMVETSDGLALVPPGSGQDWSPDREIALIGALESLGCVVVIDCGVRNSHSADDGSVRQRFVERLCGSGESVLVSSPCYLALRRAVRVLSWDDEPEAKLLRRRGGTQLADRGGKCGLVVVSEPGRALDSSDVAAVVQLPLRAHLERDPAIARRVDAGQFLHRPPRSLLKELGDIA